MWHLTACKISVSLTFLKWIKNEMNFYHISELMLATLIQRYDRKSFHFKNERLKFYRLSGATLYHCNTIYQFIKSFLDKNISIFEEYGAFKGIKIRCVLVISLITDTRQGTIKPSILSINDSQVEAQ